MNFEDIFEEVIESEVECSQGSSVCTVTEQRIQKRRFSFILATNTTSEVATIAEVPSSSHAELIKRLDGIQETQKGMFSLLGGVDNRLTAIEKALKENMPEKAEVQAQSKILRECKVIAARTQLSVSRITGDIEDEEYVELASILPMPSEETLLAVETKLCTKASSDALMRLLVKSKGVKGSVDGVLRALLHDNLVADYNLEGRKEKNRF
ncbi:PREDICTED: uncharacterized protein LOC108378279 [Rhagoletis zephyria]|uniref:uncharacterized protein LOC108378279 n=1 Tax=Rhagoletis zephyria TaxID=28612 RepID=UPI00081164F3|nr:PREDICTED: uncharacterized protein LOC108378279 [Rhagoletis zephyria]